MIQFMNTLFGKCWAGSIPYERVPTKKEDDLGKEEGEMFIRTYPVDEIIRCDEKKRPERIRKLVNALNALPITAANVDMLKKHFVEIATHSWIIQNDLTKRLLPIIPDSKSERQQLVGSIYDAVIGAAPKSTWG